MRGKGTKLGEGERDLEGKRDFAQMSFAQMSLRANVTQPRNYGRKEFIILATAILVD